LSRQILIFLEAGNARPIIVFQPFDNFLTPIHSISQNCERLYMGMISELT